MYLFRVMWIGLSVVSLSACAQGELEYHASNYNRAIESTSNDQLLLNIVRASKDLPLYFTGADKYVGAKLTTASFTPKLPFGRQASLNFDLGPKIDWSSGVTSIDLGNLNVQEALSRLSAEVSLPALESILISGVPPNVVMNLLFEGVQIHKKVYDEMSKVIKNNCGPDSPPSLVCRPIIEEARLCARGKLLDAPPMPFANQIFYQFVSRATSKCAYLKYQAFLAAFDLVGAAFQIRQKPDEKPERHVSGAPTPPTPQKKSAPATPQNGAPNGGASGASKPPTRAPHVASESVTRRQGAESAKKQTGESKDGDKPDRPPNFEMNLHFTNEGVQKAYADAIDQLKEKNLKAIEIRLRSAKRIIEYLGEITALQNYAEERYSPTIFVEGDGKSAFLFRLLREEITSGTPAALQVRGPAGENFVIPEPEYGTAERDRSLVVLSITSHIVNLSIQKSALPAPAAIEVRPVQ